MHLHTWVLAKPLHMLIVLSRWADLESLGAITSGREMSLYDQSWIEI